MTTRVGTLEASYSARGIPSYRLEVWHDGLKKHRVIKSSDAELVKRKAAMQVAEWDEKWSRAKSVEKGRSDRLSEKRQLEANKEVAAHRTEEAERELAKLNGLLRHALGVKAAIDWEGLKDKSQFPERKPPEPAAPPKPTPKDRPPEPKAEASEYQPRLSFLDKIVSSRRAAATAALQLKFLADYALWKRQVQAVESAAAEAEASYQTQLQELERSHRAAIDKWEYLHAEFLERQRINNESVDARRGVYLSGSPDAVGDYCNLVLSRSDYPHYFPQEFSLDFNPDTKILVIDYALPAPDAIPTLRGVKFVPDREEFVEQHLSQAQSAKLYDDLLYQVALRTIHELFEADVIGAIGTIVFNGIVTSVDRSTGRQVTACVLSVQTQREEFMSVNLADVEPKACFRAFKGVGSSKLHSLAAIAPIMQMRREDGRFVSAYEVANTLDQSTNLAAMDWQDFEHLIRELFEKEFASTGGEVKITQASRDGGVDAVAFDPDPIRGGKIVIQAKRYSHTVGVGAVRDLYGTVLNEGANKGILVTTADYGPDAYAFARGKPLILLSGSNLLHLLEKHGHRARIDLQEARRLAMSQPAQLYEE